MDTSRLLNGTRTMDGILYDFDLGHGFHVCICDASYIDDSATGFAYIITTEDGRELSIDESAAHRLVLDSDDDDSTKNSDAWDVHNNPTEEWNPGEELYLEVPFPRPEFRENC